MPKRPLVSVITVGFLFLSLLPLAIMALAGALSLNRSFRQDLENSMLVIGNSASTAIAQVEQSFNSVFAVVEYFMTHGDVGQMPQLIAAEQASRKDVTAITVVDEQSRVIAVAPVVLAVIGWDYSGITEISAARSSQELVLSVPFIPPQANQVIVSAYRSVGPYVVAVDLDLEYLSLFLDRLRLSTNDHILLTNAKGQVLASNKLTEVFQQRFIDVDSIPSSGFSKVRLGSNYHYLTIREIHPMDWKLLYYRDYQESRSLWRIFFGQFIAIGWVSFSLALVMAIVVGRLLSQPVVSMVKEIEHLAAGDYALRVSGDWPEELARIARQVNFLVEKVQERETDLQLSRVQLSRDLNEKSVMLKEIHHRVKNNLQVVASLLRLQEDNIRDDLDRELFKATELRIFSMALTHEVLYQSETLAAVSIRNYTQALLAQLSDTYATRDLCLDFSCDDFGLILDQAVPFGLIFNELLSNAFKYAFKDSADPCLTVAIRRICADDSDTGSVLLLAADNGPGMPLKSELDAKRSLGMSLISSLTEQLGGTIRWSSPEGGRGVKVELQFRMAIHGTSNHPGSHCF